MIPAKCLRCHLEHELAEPLERTAAALIVRIVCPTYRERAFATLLEDPETGTAIDLEAEARRIFGDDVRPIRPPISPDPPTLDELGLARPDP